MVLKGVLGLFVVMLYWKTEDISRDCSMDECDEDETSVDEPPTPGVPDAPLDAAGDDTPPADVDTALLGVAPPPPLDPIVDGSMLEWW